MPGSWHHPSGAATHHDVDEPDIQVRQLTASSFSVVRRYRVAAQARHGRAVPCELVIYRNLSFEDACLRAEAMDTWLRGQRLAPPPEWPKPERRK